MASILFKWFFPLAFSCLLHRTAGDHHPVFVSVTQIEHNAKDKILEISCKIFTDDFEQILRQQNKIRIDLLDPAYKPAMNGVVNNYIQKHLMLKADGKSVLLQFVGFEQQEEGVVTYYQVNNIATLKKVEVTNNILYETKPQQIEIIHVIVNGNRKSTKLNNPEEKAVFEF